MPPASVSFAVTDAVKRVVSVENSPVYSPTQTDPVVQLGSFKPPRSVGAPTPANNTRYVIGRVGNVFSGLPFVSHLIDDPFLLLIIYSLIYLLC